MDWQNSDVLSTKIKSKPINLSWQQNSLVERMSRKEGFPKDQGYHGKLSQPATHWISLINKWSHIILWQPHLSGIWWLIRSLDQSGFHISTIMPTNYLANKNYQSLLMQNRKDLSKRCNQLIVCTSLLASQTRDCLCIVLPLVKRVCRETLILG